jgi:hypothetical protein
MKQGKKKKAPKKLTPVVAPQCYGCYENPSVGVLQVWQLSQAACRLSYIIYESVEDRT